MRFFTIGVAVAALSTMAFADDTKQEIDQRIQAAGTVFQEINAAADKGIPQNLLEKAQCVGIIPGMKRAGFIVGGQYGKGVVVCRSDNGMGWTAPSMVKMEGGSIGLQIGAGETDVVFIVMDESGMKSLMEDKFTIGGNVAAMAGPVGRSSSAETDAQMSAKILSYSRAHGVFAGITLNGSTMRPDKDSDRVLYGNRVTQREILTGKVRPPTDAQPLYAALNQYAPAKNTAHR